MSSLKIFVKIIYFLVKFWQKSSGSTFHTSIAKIFVGVIYCAQNVNKMFNSKWDLKKFQNKLNICKKIIL
jgi:hypothetical protein